MSIKLIFIFLIFFLLRLYNLGSHEFWYDEIGTVGYAQYPWGNWNAPLYWILLHFWIKIFGISEFSLRFPSLIFSFLSTILVFILGKEMFNKKVGVIASVLIGLSPFHLWYAQEARDYSMALFLGLLSTYLFYKALKENKSKLWLLFMLCSINGIYTNYFYIFLFLSHVFYCIFLKRLKLNFKEIFCFLIIIFGFSFYLPRFLNKFSFVWQGFWIPKPNWKSLIITLENFGLGYNSPDFSYLIFNILTILSFVYIGINFRKSQLKQNLIFSLFFLIFPILAAFIFSKLFFSVYLDRGLIIFSPYYYIILAFGIESLYKEWIKKVIILSLLLLFITGIYCYYKDYMFTSLEHHLGTYIKRPIKPTVRFIEANFQKGDILCHTNPSTQATFHFYSQKKEIPSYFLFAPGTVDSSWDRPYYSGGSIKCTEDIALIDFRRLWVIACNWAHDGNLDDNSQAVKNWLDKNFKLVSVSELDGLWIFSYEKN